MWFWLDHRSTSWGKFSSQLTPLQNSSLIFSLPTMALYALVSHVNMSFPVWTEPFKPSSQGVRFPGGWGVRVVYRLERVLSTETSLLPWHMTQLLPGHVVIAFPKVIQSASGVSHDLKHITFLSSNMMKFFSFLCLPHTLSDITCPLTACWCHIQSCQSNHVDSQCRSWLFDVWTLDWGWVNVNSWVMGVNGDDGESRGLKRSAFFLRPRVTEDHYH